jgi:hypothetical protein
MTRLFTSGALAFAIAALSPSFMLPPKPLAKEETGRSYVPARTPWGDPDLQGNYTNKYEQSTPLERPDEFVGRRIDDVRGAELAGILEQRQRQVLERPAGVGPFQFRDALEVTKASRAWFLVDPPDGRIPPMTPEAARRIGPPDPSVELGIQGFVNARQRTGSSFGDGPFNGPEDLGLWDRCITRGLPGSMLPHILGNSYQIVQGPGFVGIRYELIHDTRLIPLAPRPHIGQGIRLDMGDARGRWEGDTLVVDTTNFKDRSAYRNANPATLHLVERFTPRAPGRVEWAVTVDDRTTWTRGWTFSMPLTMDDREPVLEFACHEGNYGLRNILSAARSSEHAGAETATKP